MIRNNLISFAVNLGLGVVFFLITVIAYFGGFYSHSGLISGAYRYYFAITLVVIGCGIFIIAGTYLKDQKSILRNLISVVSPIIWIALAQLLSYLLLIGEPKSFTEIFIAVCNFSNILYPLLMIIEFDEYNKLLMYSTLTITIILPTLLMWMGMEYKSFRLKMAK